MSNNPNSAAGGAKSSNAGCLRAIGYLVALVLAWQLLRGLYTGVCYVGVNGFLALDYSWVGQLGSGGQPGANGWPGWFGYALLGLGLGACAGAGAAQRRFRLSPGLAIGAGAGAALLLGSVYLTGAGRLADAAALALPPAPAAVPKSAPPAKKRAVPAPARLARRDTSSAPATGWQRVVVGRAPLRRFWADSLRRPTAVLAAGDTVRLLRQARRWVLVRAGGPNQQPGPVGWVRRVGLGPFREAEPTPTPEPAPEQPEPGEAALEAGLPRATSGAPLAWPIGPRHYEGYVGEQAAQFDLSWQPGGALSGRYTFAQAPTLTYRLTGTATPDGELRLLIFVRGRQAGRARLRRQPDGRLVGSLTDAAGQQLALVLE